MIVFCSAEFILLSTFLQTFFKETFQTNFLQTMECSKLFSGHLPEVSTKIIQNLRNDFETLYYLALVNRFWCRLAIPLLWEDPFSIKYRKHLPTHFLHFLDT